MKNYFIGGLLALVSLFVPFAGTAQFTDSSGKTIYLHDSVLAPVVKWNEGGKAFFQYQSYLLPHHF